MEQKHLFMHWFDDNKDIQKVIEEGYLYFKNKCGEYPKFCYVNKDVYKEDQEIQMTFGKLFIRNSKQVLPNIFWFGKEEKLI